MFTKAMGEMLLNSMRGDIPVVIIRPSVIESSIKEPLPGWIQGIKYFFNLHKNIFSLKLARITLYVLNSPFLNDYNF